MDKFSLDQFNERKIVTQDMLNSNGTLFGGYVLSWMDLIGHRMAIHITKRTMFTAYADKIKFKKPEFLQKLGIDKSWAGNKLIDELYQKRFMLDIEDKNEIEFKKKILEKL